MVTSMRQSSVSRSIIQGRCCDTGTLPGQLSTMEVMLKEEKISCFDEILLAVLKFSEPEKKLIQEVQTICKLLALNPITSAAGEGSFSSVLRTTSEDVVSIQDG